VLPLLSIETLSELLSLCLGCKSSSEGNDEFDESSPSNHQNARIPAICKLSIQNGEFRVICTYPNGIDTTIWNSSLTKVPS